MIQDDSPDAALWDDLFDSPVWPIVAGIYRRGRPATVSEACRHARDTNEALALIGRMVELGLILVILTDGRRTLALSQRLAIQVSRVMSRLGSGL